MTVYFKESRQRWVYNFRLRGVRHQGYCLDALGQPVTSRSAAKQAEGVARRRAEIEPKVVRRELVSLSDVIADLQRTWMNEREWPNKRRNAREIVQFFGAAKPVAAIDAHEIDRYIEFCSTQTVKVWVGAQSGERLDPALWRDTGKIRSPATVNRRLAVLRMILAHAATKMRDPLTGGPVLAKAPVFEDLPEPKRKARPTPDPVLQRLQAILPPHAVDALTLTLYFGFRRGEAFGLQEGNVDWHAQGVRLFYADVKDAKDVFLPGSQMAMGYLRCLAMEAEARGVRHLITYRRHPDGKKPMPWKPIKGARTAWRNAMAIIEKEFGRKWRWHDLRAAFITQVAMTSGPLVAQALARHADFDTTRAYIEVGNEMTRLAAERAGDRPALRMIGGGKVTDGE